MQEAIETKQSVDKRILRFIGRHRVMTLACSGATDRDDDQLWCSNLFYAYLPILEGDGICCDGGTFVFTSPDQTRHAAMFVNNPRVAGSIVLESRMVGRLQGLQFQGIVRKVDQNVPELMSVAKKAYLKRFPFAAMMLSDLWIMEITSLKYTDNTLGFGTKLHWPETI